MSDVDINTEQGALALAIRMAESSGFQLLPVGGRERTQSGLVTRMRLRGRVSDAEVEYELRYVDAGAISELFAVVEVRLTPHWVDMLAIGRGMPGAGLVALPFSQELVAEFSLRTDDEEYLSALLSGEVEKLLLTASYNGYAPRLDDRKLQLSARALDAPAAEKLLRHAVRLAALLQAKRETIPRAKRERELGATLGALAKAMNGRVDRDAMQLEIQRVEGTLSVAIVHHEYGQWSTVIELLFERPLPVKLTLAPVRAFYENWFRPDIETEDRAFDRAFTVRGEPEVRVLQILGERSRRALEALVKSAKDLLVTEAGINLQLPGVILDVPRFQAMLDQAFALAEALTAHQSGPQAYR